MNLVKLQSLTKVHVIHLLRVCGAGGGGGVNSHDITRSLNTLSCSKYHLCSIQIRNNSIVVVLDYHRTLWEY